MNIQTIFISGLLLAFGGVVGYLLKDIPNKILAWLKRKTMYSVTIYQQDELFDVLEDWLFDHYRNRYKDVEATLCSNEKELLPNEVPKKELKFKQEENFFIAKINGKQLFISKSKEKLDKAQTLKEIFYRRYIIKGFMAKDEINNLLFRIVAEYNKKKERGKLKVYSNNPWGDWVSIQDITVKPFGKIIMRPEEKSELIADIDSFTSAGDWYKQRCIRYKRCYGFYGPPGNGKTSIACAIAEYLCRDIYILNLNSLTDDGSLIRAFSTLGRNIVLLIEDIDRLFIKRENAEHSKVSFSTLLNSFDGVLCRDGIITVITTNHFENLDEALIREGRMDFKMEINNPYKDQVAEYLETFYGIKLSIEIADNGYSMSYVQEYCIRHKDNALAAINHFAKEKTAYA